MVAPLPKEKECKNVLKASILKWSKLVCFPIASNCKEDFRAIFSKREANCYLRRSLNVRLNLPTHSGSWKANVPAAVVKWLWRRAVEPKDAGSEAQCHTH